VHGFAIEDLIRVADAGMYMAKHAGGNQVASSEPFREGSAVQRQVLSSYIEGFLQRDTNGPEHLEELIGTLRKLCGSDDGDTAAIREAIETLAQTAELREPNSSGHADKTRHFAGIIARGLNLSAQEVSDAAFAGAVHDVGKLFINASVLNKSGPLTEDEFAILRGHPQLGVEVLRAVPNCERVAEAVLSHHEAFDGSGFPFGLRGESIPLVGRILAVADTYANMISERSFAPAKSHEQAIAELEKLSGTRFDGMIVRLFSRLLKMERTSILGGRA